MESADQGDLRPREEVATRDVASLSFADVWKEYGEVQALRGLDLEVPDGELITIVGPSGCGKSTALRSAAGLEEVTRGSISIGGRDVTKVPAGKRNVSMVFQSYALFPHLTVKENIGFGLAARRVPKQTMHRRDAGRRRARGLRRTSSTGTPTSCPEASGSASPSPERSCAGRTSICSTNRCPTSTPSCACACEPS